MAIKKATKVAQEHEQREAIADQKQAQFLDAQQREAAKKDAAAAPRKAAKRNAPAPVVPDVPAGKWCRPVSPVIVFAEVAEGDVVDATNASGVTSRVTVGVVISTGISKRNASPFTRFIPVPKAKDAAPAPAPAKRNAPAATTPAATPAVDKSQILALLTQLLS